jgi:hypothetical protein
MMDDYNRLYDERNKRNINNINEGLTDRSIRDPELAYQYNSLSPRDLSHGMRLSLACQSGTDMLHTVGNVTAVMLQFVLDLFPQETFATAMPSTKLAHRQLKHTPKQIMTQPYPMCIVNPRVSLSGLDNRLAAGSFATTMWSTTSNRFQNRSEMDRLLFDAQKGIEWRGKLNRVVLYLDFVLSFRSIAEQLRWASYLINKIPTDGGFFDVDTALGLALPDGFLEETAKYAGIPVHDENGSVSRFADYLNMHCAFPVSYKFASGKHSDAFFAYYMTSVLCNMGELAYNTETKTNLVESDCPITFTLRCEFNTIGLFDLSVPNPGPFRLIQPPDKGFIIPIYSDFTSDADLNLPYGWKVFAKPICKFSDGEKSVFIGTGFSNELNEMIDDHLRHGLNPELFISVKLRDNRWVVEDGYHIDWETRQLVVTHINYAHTYRVIITVNQLYINDMLNTIFGTK